MSCSGWIPTKESVFNKNHDLVIISRLGKVLFLSYSVTITLGVGYISHECFTNIFKKTSKGK